jgi:hypothetical protein
VCPSFFDSFLNLVVMANPLKTEGRALLAEAAHRAAGKRVSAHAGNNPFREKQKH